MHTYKHITVSNHIHQLGPHPSKTAVTHKVQVPSIIRDVFQVGYSINVFVPSGEALSLWHCLEWATDLRSSFFDEDRRSYEERVADAKAYKDRVQTKVRTCLRSRSHPYTTLACPALTTAQPFSDGDLMAIALTLQMHIVVVESYPTARWRHYYVSLEDKWPIVLLVRTVNNWFHLTVINDEVMFHPATATYHGLMRTATTEVAQSLIDPKLKHGNSQSSLHPLYFTLTGTTPVEVRVATITKELSRYKVAELRALAAEHAVALPSRILKADIVTRLVQRLFKDPSQDIV